MKKQMMLYGVCAVSIAGVILLSGCAKKDAVQTREQGKKQEQARVTTQAQKQEHDPANEVNGNGRGNRPEISAEAKNACIDKAVGDVCEMTMTDPEGSTKSMDGVCQSQPDDTETVMCMPARMQGAPQDGRGPGIGVQ